MDIRGATSRHTWSNSKRRNKYLKYLVQLDNKRPKHPQTVFKILNVSLAKFPWWNSQMIETSTMNEILSILHEKEFKSKTVGGVFLALTHVELFRKPCSGNARKGTYAICICLMWAPVRQSWETLQGCHTFKDSLYIPNSFGGISSMLAVTSESDSKRNSNKLKR